MLLLSSPHLFPCLHFKLLEEEEKGEEEKGEEEEEEVKTDGMHARSKFLLPVGFPLLGRNCYYSKDGANNFVITFILCREMAESLSGIAPHKAGGGEENKAKGGES